MVIGEYPTFAVHLTDHVTTVETAVKRRASGMWSLTNFIFLIAISLPKITFGSCCPQPLSTIHLHLARCLLSPHRKIIQYESAFVSIHLQAHHSAPCPKPRFQKFHPAAFTYHTPTNTHTHNGSSIRHLRIFVLVLDHDAVHPLVPAVSSIQAAYAPVLQLFNYSPSSVFVHNLFRPEYQLKNDYRSFLPRANVKSDSQFNNNGVGMCKLFRWMNAFPYLVCACTYS